MYLSSDDNPLLARPVSHSQQLVTHATISLHYLHEYIATMYYPLCATPPLNELFQNLELIDDEHFKIKLYSCSMQIFQKKYNNAINDIGCVFYLYSGRMFLGKNRDTAGSASSPSASPKQSKRRKSSVFLSALNSNNMSKSRQISDQEEQERYETEEGMNTITSLVKDKSVTEVKQNSFFSLTSYRKPNQPQKFSLLNFQTSESTSGKCLYGVLKVSQKYGTNWYLQQSKKYLFLSGVFRKGKEQLSEGKLKVISRFFKHERYRRGVTLLRENQLNEKLLIMSDGECEYIKMFSSPMSLSQKQHVIRLANAGPQSVFGCEFLMYRFFGFSKSVTVTTQALIDKFYIEQPDSEDEQQQQKKAAADQKNKKSPKKQQKPEPQKKAKSPPPKLSKETKSQEIILPLHKSAMNNFTILITSAYADFYYISLQKFKEISTKYAQQLPFNLRGIIENSYVTILRNLKEKIDLQILKIRRNNQKASEQRVMFEARVKSGHYGSGKQVLIGINKKNKIESEDSEKASNGQKLKISRSQLISISLKNPVTDMSRNKRLQKKIEIALQDHKDTVNFKKKIEVLLQEKLFNAYEFQTTTPPRNQSEKNQDSPVTNIFNPANRYSPQLNYQNKEKIISDIQEIFMNNDNTYRSQSIGRQNDILKKKENLLKKRYSSIQNRLIINEQFYDINKNKQFRVDLLKKGLTMQDIKKRQDVEQKSAEKKKSLDMKSYSNRMKKEYVEKINKANKIKEQFMTIRSECEVCHCYDDLDSLYNRTGGFAKDLKSQTMRTGSVWRLSEKEGKNKKKDQPLQKLHYRTKFISEKAVSKYHHNQHIRNKTKGLNKRRLSAPVLVNPLNN